MNERVDACSKIGATRIADRIQIYWRSKGFMGISASAVEVCVENRRHGDPAVYAIVSNIGANGFPPASISRSQRL
jgi:hypothetical protein